MSRFDNDNAYARFHTLGERGKAYDLQIREKGVYYEPPDINDYADSLALLAQRMDRYDQLQLEDGLRRRLGVTDSLLATSDPESIALIRGQRDQVKADYWSEMKVVSSVQAMERVLSKPEAAERYQLGKSGGGLIDPDQRSNYYLVGWNGGVPFDLKKPNPGDINPLLLKALAGIDPSLINASDIVHDAFGDPRKKYHGGEAEVVYRSFQARLDVLRGNGLRESSALYQLMLLINLRQAVKGRAISPIIRMSQKYGDDAPLQIAPPQSVHKERILEKLLLGDLSKKASYADKEPLDARLERNGTEFFRGYLDLIDGKTARVLFSHYSDQEAPQAMEFLRYINFFRTTILPENVPSSLVWGKVVAPLAKGDYHQCRQAVGDIIEEYPNILPRAMWPSWLDPENVELRQEEIRSERDFVFAQQAKTKQEKLDVKKSAKDARLRFLEERRVQKVKVEAERKARLEAEQKGRSEAECSNELEPFVNSLRDEIIVDAKDSECRFIINRLAGSDPDGNPYNDKKLGRVYFRPESRVVAFVEDVQDIPDARSSTPTSTSYGKFLRHLAIGDWKIEGVNDDATNWGKFWKEHLSGVSPSVISNIFKGAEQFIPNVDPD